MKRKRAALLLAGVLAGTGCQGGIVLAAETTTETEAPAETEEASEAASEAEAETMSEEERQKAVDKELVRRGLVLSDGAVLEAMERPGPGGYRFLPLRVSKSTGEITGEALVSAERLGRLEKHTRKVLEEICRELAAGNIAADPFWRGPEKNACRFCDYAAACHFEEGRGGDCRRWLPGVKAQEFWENVERETD